MKHWQFVVIALTLVVAVPMAPLWPISSLLGFGSAITPAQSAGTRTLLPIAPRGLRMDLPRPEITITSPASGSALSGTMIFQAQAADPKAVASVTFMAGSKVLATDTSSADGFKTFVKASDYPSGTLRLTAVALGTNGATTTQTVSVDVQRQVPASGAVTATGATLGTQSGGRLVVPPGAAPAGTTITVKDRSKDEVKKMTGIDYDALGITFLGAMQVKSSAPLVKPTGVNTAGFGNRVKPGDAVVTFAVLPDSSGDGTGELIVTGRSSVSPDGAVLTDPAPAPVVRSIVAASSTTRSEARVAAGSSGGVPGTILRVQGSGFNPSSAVDNVAVLHSRANGQDYVTAAIPDPVASRKAGDGSIVLTIVIPAMPPGPAELRVQNRGRGTESPPTDISVLPARPLSRPAADILDEFLGKSVALVATADSPDLTPNARQSLTSAQGKLSSARQNLIQLRSSSDPTVQQSIADVASIVEGSGILSELGQPGRQAACTYKEKFWNQWLKAAAIIGGAAAFPGWQSLLIPALLMAGIDFVITSVCDPEPPTPEPSPSPTVTPAACPAHGKFGPVPDLSASRVKLAPGGTALRAVEIDSGQNVIEGAGSAPPAGGSACGDVSTDPASSSSALSQTRQGAAARSLAGRFIVKVFADAGGGSLLTPFSGVTDDTGYFSVPLVPEGRNFTAVALDTLTGQRRTAAGVGPAVGKAARLFFDFTDSVGAVTKIQLGQATTGSAKSAAAPASYVFTGTAGQVLTGTYSWSSGGDSDHPMRFEVLGPNGDTVTSINSDGGASGTGILPAFRLPGGGPYTVVVTTGFTVAGTYAFTLSPLSATISAPSLVRPGQDVAVAWTGPNSPNDEIDIVPANGPNDQYVAWTNTTGGSPAHVRAPDRPGSYEVRYITGGSRFTVASAPLTVSPVSASISAPSSVGAGAVFSAAWTGPNNDDDEIDIVPAGGSNDEYVAWTSTSDGTPAQLRAPDQPGSYEVRYVSGQDHLTWASRPLTVTAASASVSAPSRIAGGASFAVSWTGPKNEGDDIRIVPAGSSNDDYVAWVSVADGNPARLTAPAVAGSYEVRYVSGQSSLTWASQPITVGAAVARDQSGPGRRG